MVSNKQRRRQLARAKWQRQQARRQTHAKRTRRFQLVVGTVLGLIAAAALVWVVVWIVEQEEERTPSQVTPTDGEFPSFLSPREPTTPGSTAPGTTTPGSTSPGTTAPDSTAPGSATESATTAPTRTGGTATTSTQGAR